MKHLFSAILFLLVLSVVLTLPCQAQQSALCAYDDETPTPC